MADKKTMIPRGVSDSQLESGALTMHDLRNILEVNQKALTIYLEVEQQNEKILETLVQQQTVLNKVSEHGIHLTHALATLNSNYNSVVERQRESISDIEDLKDRFSSNQDLQEDMLDSIKKNTELIEETHSSIEAITKKLEDFDKSMFKLLLVLGGTGVGTLAGIIQSLLHK